MEVRFISGTGAQNNPFFSRGLVASYGNAVRKQAEQRLEWILFAVPLKLAPVPGLYLSNALCSHR